MNWVVESFLAWPLWLRIALTALAFISIFWRLFGRLILKAFSVVPLLLSGILLLLYKLLETVIALPHRKFGGGFYTFSNILSSVGQKGYTALTSWHQTWRKAKKVHAGAAFLTFLVLMTVVLPGTFMESDSPLKMGERLYLWGESAAVNWMEEKGWYVSKEKMIQEAVYIQVDNKRILKNGVVIEYDLAPVKINNRIYMSVRDLFEALGGTVEWNNKAKNILLSIQNKSVRLYASEGIIDIDGSEHELMDPPVKQDGSFYVGVREILELLDYRVEWYGPYNIVFISKMIYVNFNETLMNEINDILN